MSWNPDQYERFADERAMPFYDLAGLVTKQPDMRVVDLGCGTGRLTYELHRRLAARETIGIERSAAMLERCHNSTEGLRFVQQDIEIFVATAHAPFDLIFANAALHWVADHEALFARLSESLAGDGQLAVQVPANHDQLPYLLAAEIANREPYASHLDGYAGHSNVLDAVGYARLLHSLGFLQQHVRLQVYGHLLSDRDQVFEWTRATTLTGYSERLPEGIFRAFEDEYRRELHVRLPDDQPLFFPFQRLLLWARRCADRTACQSSS